MSIYSVIFLQLKKKYHSFLLNYSRCFSSAFIFNIFIFYFYIFYTLLFIYFYFIAVALYNGSSADLLQCDIFHKIYIFSLIVFKLKYIYI